MYKYGASFRPRAQPELYTVLLVIFTYLGNLSFSLFCCASPPPRCDRELFILLLLPRLTNEDDSLSRQTAAAQIYLSTSYICVVPTTSSHSARAPRRKEHFSNSLTTDRDRLHFLNNTKSKCCQSCQRAWLLLALWWQIRAAIHYITIRFFSPAVSLKPSHLNASHRICASHPALWGSKW